MQACLNTFMGSSFKPLSEDGESVTLDSIVHHTRLQLGEKYITQGQ